MFFCTQQANFFFWAPFAKFRKTVISFVVFLLSVCLSVRLSVCLSVRMEQLGSLSTNLDENVHLSFFRKSVEKILVLLYYGRITGTSHEDGFIFMTISRWILLRMRNVLNKSCRENQNTHFMLSNFFVFSENRAFYEIMSKIVVEPERPQMKIWRRVACCISEATSAKAHVSAHSPTHTLARACAHTHKQTNM
jgi:hypothetical protein